MIHAFRKTAGTGAFALALAATGCQDFLAVDNPTVVEADAVDPQADANTFARSAQQNFATAYGWLTMYSAWFSGEALVTETFPTRNEFGRRSIATTNSSLNTDVWRPLSVARASADNLVHMLGGTAAETSVHTARASLFAGYSVLLMAEMFCTGTIAGPNNEPGPPLDTRQMLDAAIERFTRAIQVGTAVNTAESLALANAARVGRARAHLQAGNAAQAIADAQAVPAGFVFDLNYVDDVGNRTRLGNRLWQFTADRGSVAVGPGFRVDDPRVPFRAPGEHDLIPFETTDAQQFYVQQKYPSFATSIRLASKLEADYIAAEAQGTGAMLALINARRAANQQPAYTGPVDPQGALVEFLEQRGREFYLEGKRMGDFRRHPDAVRHVPQPGPYFKSGYGDVGNDACFPLPVAETDNNPLFRS